PRGPEPDHRGGFRRAVRSRPRRPARRDRLRDRVSRLAPQQLHDGCKRERGRRFGLRLMERALRAGELLATARERTGLADFGDPIFRDGLDVLCDAIARTELSDLGGMVWRGRLLGHLIARLHVVDWLGRHPETLAQAVPAPIFVVGLPRTGTTALSHLLAQ